MPKELSPVMNTKCEDSIFVESLSVYTPTGVPLIADITLAIGPGTLTALVGASGCGKSTLLKALAGLLPVSRGSQILYSGYSVGKYRAHYPLAISYLPQFGALHPEQSAGEALAFSSQLKLPDNLSDSVRQSWMEQVAKVSNIEGIFHQRLHTLSGGQLRRVALAEALVGNPNYLLLDELTTGLDGFSEREIMRWLQLLAKEQGKTIVIVTHATEHLDLCDNIAFIKNGRLLSHRSYPETLRSFSVQSMTEIYDPAIAPPSTISELPLPSSPPPARTLRTPSLPSGLHQYFTLCIRQGKLLLRDRGYLGAQAALIFLFPLIVALFATDGLPQARNPFGSTSSQIVKSLEGQLLYLKHSIDLTSLLSGLTLFQVILLILAAANNGAREIAKERQILENELYFGLSPWAYISSKLTLLALLSFLQSFWMAWFVKITCGIPGSFHQQFLILFLVTFSVSCTCLLISAMASTTEKASLFSIYLVGFQLPFSGATLGLPEWLSEVSRPIVAAYWGWSGYLRTFEGSGYFDIIVSTSKSELASLQAATSMLAFHAFLSIAGLYLLLRKPRGIGA